MNGLPTVSVCIANYNGLEVIDACIASVLAQDCGFPIEIIVHDDASTDGSAQYIREKYPEVRLLESDKNVGFCVANNRMAQIAQGEYLLLLNNDAELFRDALRVLQTEAECLGGPAILSLPQYDAVGGELVDIGCLFDPFLNPVPNRSPNRKEVGMVIGACLWITKSLWNELGGFPEWFGSIAEDMYLCCRARLAGYDVRALPISGYRHWQGKSFGGNRVVEKRLSTTYRRRALSERNKTFVMVLTFPGPILAFVFPLHLLLLMMEGALLSLFKWDVGLWRTIYAPLFPCLWQSRKKLLRLRGESQGQRRTSLKRWAAVFLPLSYKVEMLFKHGLPEVR